MKRQPDSGIQMGRVSARIPPVNRNGVIVMAVHEPDLELLQRQVVSVQNQTLTEWVCLIGIDGPDPVTARAVWDLVHRDERFSIREFDENVGHYRNFERLLALVPEDARWFSLCDQDDYWYPHRLQVLTDMLDELPGASCTMGQARLTDRAGLSIGHTRRRSSDLPALLLKNSVTGSLIVGRAGLLSTALPFPEPTSAARHDHWLGVVASATGSIAIRDEPLQDYVQHEGNAIGEVDLTRSTHSWVGSGRQRGVLAWLEQLSMEIWGWRVSMARALLGRVPSLGKRDRATVAAVARGSASLRLGCLLIGMSQRRLIRPSVAYGMALAAFWWPVARRRAGAPQRHRRHPSLPEGESVKLIGSGSLREVQLNQTSSTSSHEPGSDR